jgi:NUMOD4 motif/NUMOD1 domain
MPKKYNYQNTSLKDIKGEIWKDFLNLDGYCLISNYGRIKRLEYTKQYKNGAIYTLPEKIIKPSVHKNKNNFKNDFTLFLAARVKVNKVITNISIARMVYYHFVKEFDLDDKNMLALCKDSNGLNINLKNLLLVNQSSISKRVVKLGRMYGHVKNFTDEERAIQRTNIIKNISKQVSQYSIKGKYIKTFSSMAMAHRETNIHYVSISRIASGKEFSAGGFIWRWGKPKSVDVKKIREEKLLKFREKYGQKVTQYDFDGNKVAQYSSIPDAQKAVSSKSSAISLAIRGIYKTAKGYVWKAGYGKDKINLSKYEWIKGCPNYKRPKK